jgi:putative ABC transport system ATP-binding protein
VDISTVPNGAGRVPYHPGIGRDPHAGRGTAGMTVTETVTAAARAVDAVKTYGKGDAMISALAGVTVEFPSHRFTAIMGPSGSGKSTLMQCVAGLDRLTSGSVFIGDTELSSLDKTELTLLRRDRLGFIFQQYNLIPTLSAEENILLPLTLANQQPDRAWFDTIVSTVGLTTRLKNLPSQLSGGQQQRVAVARALVPRPDIVFADEPTGALDSSTGVEILSFMRRAVDESGQTIVMVTHDPHAASYADNVLFLADGQIIDEMAQPTTERVLDRMKRFEA